MSDVSRSRLQASAARREASVDGVQNVYVHETGLDLIAVTLAIMLSVPLLVPALYGSSTIAVSDLAGDRPGRLSDRNQVGGDYGDARLRGTGPECGLSSGFPI
jgi:hypothetical protein